MKDIVYRERDWGKKEEELMRRLEIYKYDPRIWYVSFKGAENTLYANENFTLQFKFSNEYVSRFF